MKEDAGVIELFLIYYWNLLGWRRVGIVVGDKERADNLMEETARKHYDDCKWCNDWKDYEDFREKVKWKLEKETAL